MNVNEFKGSFADMGRLNLFEVQLTGPIDPNLMRFHCKAAQLPSSTIGVIEVPYRGRIIKLAGDRTYEEWTVSVFCEDNYGLRSQFYDWHEQINQTIANTGPGSAEAYKQNGTIMSRKTTGAPGARFNFTGLWPTNVGAVEFSAESTNTVAEFTVTFAFDWFER